jgi:hypothetical protein
MLDLGFREAKSGSDEGLDIDLPTNEIQGQTICVAVTEHSDSCKKVICIHPPFPVQCEKSDIAD